MKIKTKLVLLVASVFLSFYAYNLYAHSGNTNASGCHMDYSTGYYHCHAYKYEDPYKLYYCIYHQGRVYGKYSSYSSCSQAARGAGLMGYYCGTC